MMIGNRHFFFNLITYNFFTDFFVPKSIWAELSYLHHSCTILPDNTSSRHSLLAFLLKRFNMDLGTWNELLKKDDKGQR